MEFDDIKKIIILGIGGRGAYYIVKFLHLLDIEIEGYDIKESERTKELEGLGIKINYSNPKDGEKLDCDMYIYSNDLPKELQEKLRVDNGDTKFSELGHFYHQIIDKYESGNMDEREIKAFKDSNIGPLFEIDTTKMRYIGITGTDGKTTTCYMIYHLLKEAGFKPALISTVAAYIGNEKIDTGLHTTTPSSQEVYELIKRIENEECTHIIIEATSHGLEQGRLAGLKFDSVGYTNVTSEHLDYHGDWDNYCNVKSFLITKHLKENGNVVLNFDDRSYDVLSKLVSSPITYSTLKESDFRANNLKEEVDKILFELTKENDKYDVTLPLLGSYNVSNFLCALAICKEENLNIAKMIENISSFKTVTGRMEVIQSEPFTVIVDYAHTANAVEKVLESSRLLIKENGKLIHVFGCAGRRDFYKRPEMGKISNELSDVTILTAEDPRFEDLKDINYQIEEGWRKGENKNAKLFRFDYMDKNVQVRRDAIVKGLKLAEEGDVVIITGKAHEESLCFGQIEYPWNDLKEVKNLLK